MLSALISSAFSYRAVPLLSLIHICDVFQMDDRAIGVDPQRDLAKLLRIFEPRLSLSLIHI